MSSPRMGPPHLQDIQDLAGLLRKNGDQVLNGCSKLSLSTKLLHNLNDAFSLIIDSSKDLESSFQVCNSSEVDVFRDLKFLHDFVQKTISLKISQTPTDPKTSIDITKFRHLRYLELQKICIDMVSGIQGVRGQLESIFCSGAGGVGTIGRLLTACGGDAGAGFVWASLKRLSLPYNGLGRLDRSLELAPWLQTLDLSHNLISTAGEIDCLPNLKHINFGYNKLESVPRFNRATCRTLQTLVLKNNYIETLSGLQGLDCLAELDLSYNCLADHSVLWPLETMTGLLWMTLEGNPLSYHIRHRALTIKHLNSSLAEGKFVLDHSQLSKSEKIMLSENKLFAMRSVSSPCKEDLTSSFSCSTTSESNVSGQSDVFTPQMTESISSIDKSFKGKRRKVREAVIADDEIRDEVTENVMSTSYLETSMDHLETKKKILALREKFGGEKWLSSDAGSVVQDIMGMERGPIEPPTSVEGLTSETLEAPSDPDVLEVRLNPADVESLEVGNDDKSVSLEEKIEDTPEKIAETFYDPEEETGQLFLVQKKRDFEELEELFLVITPEDIKERDSITGKVKYRWSMETVLSCVMGRGVSPTINFIFDTTRRDRQNRTYFVEAEDAVKIVDSVCEVIKGRRILLKVFKCMKCSTHFSQDPDYFLAVSTGHSSMKPPRCPSCKSTLVIQTDELLTSDGESEKDVSELRSDNPRINPEKSDTSRNIEESSTNLHHSTSHSSIGGTGGDMTSMVCYQPQVQICWSATSLEESRESTPSTCTVTKKYESDIEVLSNPSQSSIEVLDDGTRSTSTPSRKRSSEERRIAVAPTLLTIPDTAPIMAGLTESSSSGSLTDSICTAYENRNLQASILSAQSHNRSISESEGTLIGSDSENINNPVSNLSTMLGGLLQSMKIGTHRGSPIKSEDGPDFSTSVIQYSYTDFKSLDHRIKLHLILNVFEQENEELILLVRSDILIRNQSRPFPGCLVLSTFKIYVLRINGIEGDDPQRWLQKEMSWTTDRLRTFAPLPFKQGVMVELQQPNKIGEEPSNLTLLCILQDFQRTSNLLLYLTELSLPPSCELEFLVPESCTASIHSLMANSKYRRSGDAVRILAIFSSASLQLENQEVKRIKIGGLVVTTSSLILTEDSVHWLLPDSGETPVQLGEQAISNLIEVIFNDESLILSFLDEVAGVEEIWTIKFISSGAAEAVINAIQPPWEELFSVPLQITTTAPEQNVEDKL